MVAAKTHTAAPRAGTRSPKAAGPQPEGGVLAQKIAERAYQIWQESGCPDGCDLDHWLRAERELRAGQPAPRPASR